MIKEDFVSFEVAKLLKEKGFDEKCSRWYAANEPQEGVVIKGFGENQIYIPAPTHQMAMAWLREKHSILITIIPQEIKVGVDKLCYAIHRITEDVYTPLYNGYINNLVDSYEEAVEAALKYTLEKLI